MSTSAAIGFAKDRDNEDFVGIYIDHDGDPRTVITHLALYIKFGRFSDVVKGIKSGKQANEMNYPEDVLNGAKPMFDFYSEPAKPVDRDDMFQSSHSYVIKNKNTIHHYQGSGRSPNIHKLNFDLLKIVKEKKLFDTLFDGEKMASGGLRFYQYLDDYVWDKIK